MRVKHIFEHVALCFKPAAPLAVLALLFLTVDNSVAQTAPRLIVSWKADSYVAEGFLGKALPAKNSVVTASVEVIDANQFADLTKTEIRWLLDNDELTSGVGRKIFKFRADKQAGDFHELKAMIPNWRGAELQGVVEIPVTGPEIVINSPYPNNQIKTGQSEFRALMYFFNVADPRRELNFEWMAGEQVVSGKDSEPDKLILNIPPEAAAGSVFDLAVSAENPRNETEAATAFINNLTISK